MQKGILVVFVNWIRNRLNRNRTKRELIITLMREMGQEWFYGLDLVKAPKGQLERGTIYVLLDQLEREGSIESRAEESEHGPHRAYRLARGRPKKTEEARTTSWLTRRSTPKVATT
jgi:hypothetical protein